MENLIFSSVPINELKEELIDALRKEVKECLSTTPSQKDNLEYITRKEAAAILRISLPTLAKWTSQGLIKGKRIGSRVRYLRSEVELSLNSIKTASTCL